MLDVDKDANRAALTAALDSIGCDYLAFNSTSHGVDGREAWRVVIPLAEPITGTPEEISKSYAEVWEYFAERVPGVDRGAKDCTRLNYLPFALPGAPERSIIVQDRGSRFSAAKVPAPSEAPDAISDAEVRTAISEDDWQRLLDALRFLLDKVADNATWSAVGYGLLSLQSTRPVRELWYEFSKKAAGYEPGAEVEWWDAHRGQQPRSDWRHIYTMAGDLGWQQPPRVASLDAFQPPVTAEPATVDTAAAVQFKPAIPNLDAPRPKWLVKYLLVEGSLVIIFGRWGTGKSTVAIELGVAVARGLPWHNRKVRGGKVVHISCENAHGVRSRLSAVLKDQGITLDDLHGNFLEIANRPHLLKVEEVQELIAQLKAIGPIALIVVDTLARATAGGEENSAKDAGLLVGNCQSISESTGACVMLIHHTGKDESRGMRGSSNLPASADTEIELERPSETENIRIAKLGKQRDAPDYCELFRYELAAVTLGTDEDGDPITSTVVRELQAQSEIETTMEAPKNPIRRVVWSALDSAMRPMEVEELITKCAATSSVSMRSKSGA